MGKIKNAFDAIVVGELNVDIIFNDISSFPQIGKEILAGKMNLVLGSSSAIFASNLAALGARVAFCGLVGNDSYGEFVLEKLKNNHVDTTNVLRLDTVSTGATLVLNYDNDRAMITFPGTMEVMTLKDIPERLFGMASHLHLSSCFLLPGLKKDLIRLFTTAKENGMSTSLDTQWDPAEKWDLSLRDILPLVDILLPNEIEFLKLTKSENIDEALNFVKPFANTIAIKQGVEGSTVWSSKSGKIIQSAFLNNSVIDAIGAGDSFNAGFIYQFLQNESPGKCQEFANLMGAVSTTEAGGTRAFQDYEHFRKVAREKFNYKVK
jgi:sugar/nucleoside kinase (ribokinase family)